MTHKNIPAYETFIDQLREVAAGKRGWVSITVATRETGFDKEELCRAAVALGLNVTRSHGRHGTTCHK